MPTDLENTPMKQDDVTQGVAFKSGTRSDYIFELNARQTKLRFHEVCALIKVMQDHVDRYRAIRDGRE